MFGLIFLSQFFSSISLKLGLLFFGVYVSHHTEFPAQHKNNVFFSFVLNTGFFPSFLTVFWLRQTGFILWYFLTLPALDAHEAQQLHALPVFLAFDLNNLLLFVYFPHCYGSCYYVQKRRCSCYILWFLYIHKNSWAFLFSTANSRFVCFPHLKHTDLFNMKNYTIFNSADSLDVLNFADGAAGGPFCPFTGKISMRKHACHTCLRFFVFSDFFRYLNNNMKCIGFVTRTRRSQSDRKKKWNRKKSKTSKNIKSTEFM